MTSTIPESVLTTLKTSQAKTGSSLKADTTMWSEAKKAQCLISVANRVESLSTRYLRKINSSSIVMGQFPGKTFMVRSSRVRKDHSTSNTSMQTFVAASDPVAELNV